MQYKHLKPDEDSWVYSAVRQWHEIFHNQRWKCCQNRAKKHIICWTFTLLAVHGSLAATWWCSSPSFICLYSLVMSLLTWQFMLYRSMHLNHLLTSVFHPYSIWYWFFFPEGFRSSYHCVQVWPVQKTAKLTFRYYKRFKIWMRSNILIYIRGLSTDLCPCLEISQICT